MSHEVYADGWEIAGNSGMNKSIARFPDVCLSPPSPPAGPIPVPYPDTSFSSDLKEGSKTVTLSGKPAALAQQSYYKPSVLGDEAATRSFGANVITHQITGKTYFQAWSMDVKIEGKNVCRHFDITTSNHASGGSTTVGTQSIEASVAGAGGPQLPLLCECCNMAPPHSAAQRRGETITEAEFYGPTQTGLRQRTGRGGVPTLAPNRLSPAEARDVATAQNNLATMREWCPDQFPPNPPGNDPCNRYYRLEPGEKEAIDLEYENLNNVRNPHRPAAWAAPGVLMIAHRVPRIAGGCPIGPNAVPVTNAPCAELDHDMGRWQGRVAEIAANHTLP
jgi:hypothetical protein